MTDDRQRTEAAMRKLLGAVPFDTLWSGDDGITVACDGHAAILVPWEVDVVSHEPATDAGRRAVSTIVEWAALPPTHQTTRDQLAAWIGEVGDDGSVTCHACDGDGECECDRCGHHGKCVECDGEGVQWVPISKRMGDARLFGGCFFDGVYLTPLLEAMGPGPISVGVHDGRIQLRDSRGVVGILMMILLSAGQEARGAELAAETLEAT